MIISCSNTEFDDGSIFNFTTDSSTATLPYKVSISENGNYFDSTFVLTNVGDIMSWQTEERNTLSGNFKSAIIPIYIKSGTLLAGAYLQAGNYTSTIYVNAVDPN